MGTAAASLTCFIYWHNLSEVLRPGFHKTPKYVTNKKTQKVYMTQQKSTPGFHSTNKQTELPAAVPTRTIVDCTDRHGYTGQLSDKSQNDILKKMSMSGRDNLWL